MQTHRTKHVCAPTGSDVRGSSSLSNDRVTTLGVEPDAVVRQVRQEQEPAMLQADDDDLSSLRFAHLDSTADNPDGAMLATSRSAILVLCGAADDNLVMRKVSIHRITDRWQSSTVNPPLLRGIFPEGGEFGRG